MLFLGFKNLVVVKYGMDAQNELHYYLLAQIFLLFLIYM